MKKILVVALLVSTGGCRFLIDVQPDFPGERVRVTLRNSSQYTIWLERDGVQVRWNEDKLLSATGNVVRIPPGGIHVVSWFNNDQYWTGKQGVLLAKYEVPGQLYAKTSEPVLFSVGTSFYTQHYQMVVYEPEQPLEVVWLNQPAHYPGYMQNDYGSYYYGGYGSYSYGPVYMGNYSYSYPATSRRRCK